MPQPLLYAVGESGPEPLPVPDGATGFEALYAGLEPGVYSSLRTFSHRAFLDYDAFVAGTVRPAVTG